MINEIKKEIDRFFVGNLNKKYKKLCYRLFDDFVKTNEDDLNDDSVKIWAGGFVYAICQINLLFDRAFKDHIEYTDICSFYGESKQTLIKKGIYIRKSLDADLLDERYATTEAINRAPKIDYSKIDDELDIMYSNGNQIVLDHRETSHSYLNKQDEGYSLDSTIFYGSREYPTSSFDYDIYTILFELDENPNLDNVFSKVEFKTANGEGLLKDTLESNGLIEPVNFSTNPDELSAQELSDMLKDKGITASGKKKKLLELVKAIFSEEELNGNNYELTQKGYDFLEENEWVELSRMALDKFDYNDYSRYLDEHENLNLTENTLNYLEQHIHLAIENEDFGYLSDCYNAIGQTYLYEGNIGESEKWQLRNLILRMNPIYDYETYYQDELIFTPEIAVFLQVTYKMNDESMTEELFKEIWDEMEIEKEFVSVSDAYEWYLKLVNHPESHEDLSDDYVDSYIF